MLPEADGGDGELTYSLAPALPEGLSFAAGTRTLSGTPSAAGEYAMTYTAADEDGDEASFTFTITVLPPPPTARICHQSGPWRAHSQPHGVQRAHGPRPRRDVDGPGHQRHHHRL